MAGSEAATPLWLTPLLKYQREETEIGHYETLKRLISPSQKPDSDEAEIETVVESFIGPGGLALWRRVVVRSGPSCPKQAIHASYMLPNDAGCKSLSSGPIVCWAAFPEHPEHKLLCVLGSPTLLYIWDVYPRGKEADLGGEGHSIALPFEACGIHSIEGGHGLLLQRTETLEDGLAFDAQNRTWTSTGLQGEDEEDGFVLKAPPRSVRMRESTGTSLGSLNLAAQNTAVPSLFSLSHPLDDILPVSKLLDGEIHALTFTDVFEKIIFTGEIKWTDPKEATIDRKEYSRSICVTYHIHKKRHAIWVIKKSPPPPPQAPLWQVTSQRRSERDWNSHLGGLQQDLEDLELLGSNNNKTLMYEAETRNEALADALGVRKTPRKAMEDMAPRARIVNMRSNRKHVPKAAVNSSLLSPLSRPGNETMMEVDTSVESAAKAPIQSLGTFSSLYPEIAMTCIYEEAESMPQARNVFLISNLEGSGTLTICLVCPKDDQLNPNQAILHDFMLVGQNFEVTTKTRFPCIAATPLNSSAVPGCFLPHQRNVKGSQKKIATDLFLLHADISGERILSIYRNDAHIVDCSILKGYVESNATVINIDNSVGNKVDISFLTVSKTVICLRASLALRMESSFIGETIIQAVESALCSPSFSETCPAGPEIALKFRTDCIRMEHLLLGSKYEASDLAKDVGSAAVGSVLSAIFALEILSQDVNQGEILSEVSPNINKSAWEQLLESEYHQSHSWNCQDFLYFDNKKSSNRSKGPLQHLGWKWDQLSGIKSLAIECIKSLDSSVSSSLFDALHFTYEEFKLHCNSRDAGLTCVGKILCQVCIMASSDGMAPQNLFLEHYKRDLGEEYLKQMKSSMDKVLQGLRIRADFSAICSYDSPPCILSWVDSHVSGKDVQCGFNTSYIFLVNATCTRTLSLLRIFSLLYGDDENLLETKARSRRSKDHEVVRALIDEGFVDKVLLRDDLPAGVSLPLLEVLYRCRSDKEILGLSHEDAKMWSLIGREDLCQNAQKAVKDVHVNERSIGSISLDLSEDEKSQMEDKDMDGICPLEVTSSMLFPNDNRIREVGRLLRSSRPTYLNVPRAIEVSDHDFERLKQEKLLFLSRRILALPVGRGMFTIGNLQPVPAEPLPLPEISLVGRVPPTNAMLALDTSDCPSDLKVWPEFHNGVAAGLRLPLEADAGETVSKITRTWIVYNRPEEAAQPQNNSNPSTNPKPSPIHAYGGLLMALGLRGHLTTLEMTDIFDYLTQGTVTTTVGVLLGMAVNMRGSCDISVSKMLCLHIPSLIPQHFSAIDVASPVQAAAVAGAGLLYQGSSHRMMTEFLLNEIGKRPSSDVNILDREAYTLSCGFALGMVNLCQGDPGKGDNGGGGNAGLSDLRIEERLYRYVVGGLDDTEMRGRRDDTERLHMPSSSSANGNEKCSCIHEGDSINTDVTSPGATLALGLIYMKSGNKTIASALALPDTHFLLEYVRPDFLMLRVIARALILWDDVRPSKAWIKSQTPQAVEIAYEKMRTMAQTMSQQSNNSTSVDDDREFDRQAIRLIHTHIVAGSCFAIGLRYAGTGNREAAASIFECIMELRDLRDGIDPVSCALRPQAPVLEMCLGCAAISLSMVLAGSGDLEVLRLLKVLRWRCDEEVHYGSHMAYGTAIGLLFLGGGTCTLGREPEDIAAMLMAFYPRFPTTTADNQYHLQALRNLYAIAVKDREIRAVDVDTGECVYVPIQVHFENDSMIEMTAPCLLFNTDAKPKELRVVSERYYPVTLSIDYPKSRKTFFVKRRSAHLSYLQDPHSQRSLLVQTGSFQEGTSLDLISSFTDDQKVLAFAKHLCDVGQSHSRLSLTGPFSVEGFCSRVLHECLLLDSEEALPLYVALRNAILSVQAGISSAVPYVWDFRMIRAYYEQRHRIVPDTSPRLLNSEIVAYLCELLENAIFVGGKSKLTDGSVAVYYDQPIGDSTTSMDLS